MVLSFEDTNALMDDWPDWQKITSLAVKEAATQPFLRKLLKSLENSAIFSNTDAKFISLYMCSAPHPYIGPYAYGKSHMLMGYPELI